MNVGSESDDEVVVLPDRKQADLSSAPPISQPQPSQSSALINTVIAVYTEVDHLKSPITTLFARENASTTRHIANSGWGETHHGAHRLTGNLAPFIFVSA